ncbi:MAG TPA: hypothetical protein PLJ21_04455 [Pseudobdellovibrionaceae bacterium]|nr:hypothetical protein [Pseudobdellovibrionaceae bacterium]
MNKINFLSVYQPIRSNDQISIPQLKTLFLILVLLTFMGRLTQASAHYPTCVPIINSDSISPGQSHKTRFRQFQGLRLLSPIFSEHTQLSPKGNFLITKPNEPIPLLGGFLGHRMKSPEDMGPLVLPIQIFQNQFGQAVDLRPFYQQALPLDANTILQPNKEFSRSDFSSESIKYKNSMVWSKDETIMGIIIQGEFSQKSSGELGEKIIFYSTRDLNFLGEFEVGRLAGKLNEQILSTQIITMKSGEHLGLIVTNYGKIIVLDLNSLGQKNAVRKVISLSNKTNESEYRYSIGVNELFELPDQRVLLVRHNNQRYPGPSHISIINLNTLSLEVPSDTELKIENKLLLNQVFADSNLNSVLMLRNSEMKPTLKPDNLFIFDTGSLRSRPLRLTTPNQRIYKVILNAKAKQACVYGVVSNSKSQSHLLSFIDLNTDKVIREVLFSKYTANSEVPQETIGDAGRTEIEYFPNNIENPSVLVLAPRYNGEIDPTQHEVLQFHIPSRGDPLPIAKKQAKVTLPGLNYIVLRPYGDDILAVFEQGQLDLNWRKPQDSFTNSSSNNSDNLELEEEIPFRTFLGIFKKQ